jgi:glycosyltransferase involved in cell wall biosynthesis
MTENKMTSLSVVLSNFNHARFLCESLGSLLIQTRPANEVIIIDDASTDRSVDLILKMISAERSAKLVCNSRNIGCVATMNKGLEMATGDIVFFAAADDVYYPRLFEVGLRLLNAYPLAALFSASSDLIDAIGVNYGRFSSPIPLTTPGFLSASASLRQMLRDDGWFMGNTTLYRRSALLAEGKFDEELGAFADGYMCRLLALQHGACFTSEILAAWRRLEGGMAWSNAMNIDRAKQFVALVEARMLGKGGLFPAEYIHRWRRRHLFGGRRFSLTHCNSLYSGPLGHVKRTINILRILWLFLILRPWDLGPVLRRRIHEIWDRRMGHA